MEKGQWLACPDESACKLALVLPRGGMSGGSGVVLVGMLFCIYTHACKTCTPAHSSTHLHTHTPAYTCCHADAHAHPHHMHAGSCAHSILSVYVHVQTVSLTHTFSHTSVHLTHTTTRTCAIVHTHTHNHAPGVAPLRSFLEELWWQHRLSRASLSNLLPPPAPATLFFGCRARDADLYYAEQWEQYVREGVLHPAHGFITAFSREPGAAKEYVTHRIREHHGHVWQLIQEVRRARGGRGGGRRAEVWQLRVTKWLGADLVPEGD